jgi:hypothetical protein
MSPRKLWSMTPPLYLIFALVFCWSSDGSAKDIKETLLAKAKDQLIAKLQPTQPKLADYFKQVDAATWGRYAGEISAGNSQAVFEEVYEEKKKEILDDLYEKGKDYAINNGILGEETKKYVEWAETYGNDAFGMAEKAYNGDFKGAGDVVIKRMKEELQAKAKSYLTGVATEAIDFFLKDLVGQSVGAVYFKIIELEMAKIEEFREYTIDYFGTFQDPPGSGVKRNWCGIYAKLRKDGFSPDDAFGKQLSASPLPDSIAALFQQANGLWYSTQNTNSQRPDEATFKKELELCYLKTKLPDKAAIQTLINKGRSYADEILFGEIKKGMDKRKQNIIIIIDQVKDKTKLPPDFSLIVTVADKDTNQKIPLATVSLDGEKKDATDGTVTYKRDLPLLDPDKSGNSVEVSAEAKGYDSKTESFNIGTLANRYDENKSEVQVRISLSAAKKPVEDITVDLTITDKKTENKISGAKATFDGETKDAPGGVASYARKSSMLDPDKSGDTISFSAEATGYKPSKTSFTIGELATKLDKEKNRIAIAISLDPEDKDKVDEIDRIEVQCDPKEILETEVSFCKAMITFKSGKAKDVSGGAKWTPGFVEAFKGTVKGQEAKTGNSLPYTVTVEATYDAPAGEGGKSWTAKGTVLVKPASGEDQPNILVQKVADAQNVKPGEEVTYVYSVTNTGTVPLIKIQITDDKCSPVTYLRGAINYAGGLLPPNETWEYQCAVKLKATTENTAMVEAYTSTNVKVTNQAKVTVTVGPCPPQQVKVPYLFYKTSDEARTDVQKNGLRFFVSKLEYSDSFAKDTVMDQDPRDDACVDRGSMVNAVISLGPKTDKPAQSPQARLTAEMDCGESFELRPGDFIGKACNITVRGWRSNTDDPVELKVSYNKSSGIESSGDYSVPGSLMYSAGVTDYYDRRVFTQNFKARENAPEGTTSVTITVSQKEAGEVRLSLRIAVLTKGQLPSTGPGIRPPATVVTGSGGSYCVWRYKLIGDPPPCFHFVAAVCGRYGPPSYELVGDRMTWGEADARVGQLSRYFDDQYGCSSSTTAQTPPAATGPTTLTVSLECGGGLELVPGEMSKPCNVIVSGWRSDKAERINVKIQVADGPFLGKIETIPGNTSVDPGNIYATYMSGGKTYLISEGFAARSNAPAGTAKVTITVSQTGAGQVSVPLDLMVLPKGATASSGPGVRPPATVAAGSGGNFCVWRYKMFGDPPPCFHFVAAVCGKYGLPSYELVGDRMTWGEADARVGQLSRYFDDQYACSAATAKPPQQTTPTPPKPPAPPPPPPPPACRYEYWGWSDCQPDNTRSRTVRSSTPEGCIEAPAPVLIGACTYTPPPPVLTRFGVYCSPSRINENGTSACRATGEYSNAIGTYVDLTARASWNNGPTFEGKGKQEGSYPVTATLEGASDTATVTVLKGYDPNKDPGIPGKDKPVDPNTIKGPMAGFAAGPGQGTRPEKPQQPEAPVPIPTDYTRPPDQPKPQDQPGTGPTSGGGAPTTGGGQQPTKPGIDVTVVGTAPAGKCTIVTGQLVAVQGYKENISGMTVVLTGPTSKTATSGGGGAFSFSDIPAGKYVLSVTQWNYGMTKADFVCESGKAVKVVMKGSCPYLYVWTGEAYEQENDIYSVARLLPQELLSDESRMLAHKEGTSLYLLNPEHMTEKIIKEKSMVDYYRMTRTPMPDPEGNYRLKIVEQATEQSFTDRVRLMAVNHQKGTQVGITREGTIFMVNRLTPITSWQYGSGRTQSPGRWIDLYNDDRIELSLPAEAFRNGILAITWQGFLDGNPEGRTSAAGRPQLALQRMNPQGQWQTVDWVYPRDEVQESFLLLKDLGLGWDQENKIRLKAVSCEPHKYHRLGQVAWGSVLKELPTATYLDLLSAVKGTGEDVKDALGQRDGKALYLGPKEEATLVFKGELSPEGTERSFIFLSEGFYIPLPLVRFVSN